MERNFLHVLARPAVVALPFSTRSGNPFRYEKSVSAGSSRYRLSLGTTLIRTTTGGVFLTIKRRTGRRLAVAAGSSCRRRGTHWGDRTGIRSGVAGRGLIAARRIDVVRTIAVGGVPRAHLRLRLKPVPKVGTFGPALVFPQLVGAARDGIRPSGGKRGGFDGCLLVHDPRTIHVWNLMQHQGEFRI